MIDKPKPEKYKDVLMQAFEFDELALEQNAAGKLTPNQRRRVYALSRRSQTAIFFFTFVSGVALIGYGARLWANPTTIFFIVIPILLMLAISMRSWWWVIADAKRGGVESIEGRVRLDVQGSSRFSLNIGDESFEIDKLRFLALKNGDPYRVYYAPRTKHVLSVEWLFADRVHDEFIMVEERDLPAGDVSAANPDYGVQESRAARSKR